MALDSTLDSLSLTEQVVLLGLVAVHRADETPAQTHELRRHCNRFVDGVEADVVGKLTEADVMRSLYRLEDDGFIEEVDVGERSPTGKGRPAYELDVPEEAVSDGVDDRLTEALEESEE